MAGETCMNLIVEGKVARTAAGPNVNPGGSERLAAASWDVAELAGREATIEIVDARKGGWGHINVDQIVLVDDRGAIPLAGVPKPPPAPRTERTRNLTLNADFLQLPLKKQPDRDRGRLGKLSIEADGKVLRYLHVELAPSGAAPDTVYSYDVREFKGREVTLRYPSADAKALDQLTLSDAEVIDPNAYDGPHRPRFHFSPRLGWMNDVNGSYWQDGLYHVFYQFNPTNPHSGAGFDMHWGHSVSRDLVHWEEWPVALFPDGTGQCYSGTAIVAQQPIPGLIEKAPAPVLFFSATSPFSQHIATTNDNGRTWQRFAGNPVVKNMGDGDRDPKVVWHEPSQHYVMVLYVGGPDTYRFLRSKDLTKWEQTSQIAHWFECPEFFPLKSPTTGETLWVLYGCYRTPKDAPEPFNSRSCYQIGKFDGQTFTPVTKIRDAHEGGNFYASLVFMNQPQGRQIIMGWASGTSFPGEPFNQCASLPLELTLKSRAGEDTLCFEPAVEVNALRGKPLLKLTNVSAADAQKQLAGFDKDALLDVTVRFKPEATGAVKFRVRNVELAYDPATHTIARGKSTTVIHPGASIDARFLIDRGIVESFWNGGEASYAVGSLHTADGPAFAIEGSAAIEELVVYPMADIWKK